MPPYFPAIFTKEIPIKRGSIGVGRGGGGGGGGRGRPPPNNLRGGGGGNIPNNPPTFSFNFCVKQEKSQMYQVEG